MDMQNSTSIPVLLNHVWKVCEKNRKDFWHLLQNLFTFLRGCKNLLKEEEAYFCSLSAYPKSSKEWSLSNKGVSI